MADKKINIIEEEIELENPITAKKEGDVITLKGPKGENSRRLFDPTVVISVEGNIIKVSSNPKRNATRNVNKMVQTFTAHIENLIKGVTEGHMYKLKICSGHFPMNVSITGNEFIVKNFIGEKIPRKVELVKGTTVKVEGSDVIVEGIDREKTGMMAARIEQMTRRPGFDTRIFQDGIYIVEKDGKEIKG